MNKTIIFTGGGTAGHVTPNLEIIPFFINNGWNVFYVGSKYGMEKEIVTKSDVRIKFLPIHAGKLRRYFSLQNVVDIFLIGLGIIEAFIIIKKYKPDKFAIEDLYFFKNQKTAFTVGQARGAIILAAQEEKLPISEPTPLQVKQAVSGYGQATKDQVQKMVKLILKLCELPKPDDAADALAIAIYCANNMDLKQK